jgi:transposase InsO family protein
MSYQIIEAHREANGVETMGGALGVSVSGYYAWRKRPLSQHAPTDAALLNEIQTAYQIGHGLYGSPRIHAGLHQQGVQYACGDYTDLLREHGVQISMAAVGKPEDNG